MPKPLKTCSCDELPEYFEIVKRPLGRNYCSASTQMLREENNITVFEIEYDINSLPLITNAIRSDVLTQGMVRKGKIPQVS